MSSPPRGVVEAHVLADLLSAVPQVVRKRVTLAYRVHTPADSAAIADRDLRTAIGKTGARGGVDQASVTAAAVAAQQAAREEAAGAGLTRFALLVTATVDDVEHLARAADTVDQLARASRIRLRRAYGSQSAAFATCLGVGIVPAAHVLVPDALRDAL
jgi:hypothetical protein